jgi:hypothetical protein
MPRRKKTPAPPPDELAEAAATTYIPPPVVAEPLSFADTARFMRVAAELVNRQCEALKLYEPLPIIDRFHACDKDERLLRGSNRAGKTLGAAVEMARAVTGQDPYGKYPKTGGKAFLIGLDEQHLGDVMYAKLFRAQAFKMIRDEETGLWRTFHQAADGHRAAQAKWAPPLIPQRYIKEISWKDKKRFVPGVIRLTTGWEMYFFSSKGAPPQGSDIDLCWPDEEIENEAWYPEMAARLVDRKGKFYWSATPQIASQQLYDLHVRFEAGDPNIGEFIALLEDNPHIGQTEKDKLYSKYTSDEERRVRIKGEFALSGFKVYPEYSKAIHGLDWDGPIPADWTRYMVVDPGRQVCAVLFGAVPPPGHALGDVIVLYDELYIKQCDAAKFGVLVKEKSEGVAYEAFLIDSHASRITEMGSGLNVEVQYSQALHKSGVKCRRTGCGFTWGADDPKAGQLAVHAWLRIREDGTTKLRVLRGRLPQFEWEVERYHFRRINKLVSDEAEKKHDHLMDDLRYLAMYMPSWVKPPRVKAPDGYAVKAMKAKAQKRRKKIGSDFVRLGPGNPR